MTSLRLTDLLCGGLSPHRAAEARAAEAALEPVLVAALESCRAQLMGAQFGQPEFLRHLARCVERGPAFPAAVSQLLVDDLYVAYGCAVADAAALAELDRSFFAGANQVFRRAARHSPENTRDLAQRLRERLLTARPGAAPRIAEFTGRGSLRSWLKVAALRLVLNESGGAAGTPSDEDLSQHVQLRADGPELEVVRRSSEAHFEEALAAALTSLEPRQRNLLRYTSVEGLTLDQLAALHRVHRATVARWLAQARSALKEAVRLELWRRLQLRDDEVLSLMRLVRSRLDVSLPRLLGAE